MPPAIVAALSSGGAAGNLFAGAPPNPSLNDPLPAISSPPLSLPKHPKPNRKNQTFNPPSSNFDPENPKLANPRSQNPAFRSTHLRTRYHKPIRPSSGELSGGDRSVQVGPNGVSYRLPGAPFDFQFSYSETPKAAPIAIREPAFLPFAPPSMPRPWTGKAPLLSKKEKEMKKGKKMRLVEPLGSGAQVSEPEQFGLVREVRGKKGLSEHLRLGMCKVGDERSREEVLGKPLTRAEIKRLIKPHLSHNRQVNLGRDGLTHNMLELIHCHWRRDEVCKVRCRGVPTVDMDNICLCLEEKTGGKVIHKIGGIIYLFRGRNYDPKTRPRHPIMLWKPAAPVYPKLIQDAPEGLTREEANEMRAKTQNLPPICKLAKNGIYINLVKDVRDAFEGSELVKIDCEGMHASDYKKLGAKLKELVPCTLLSFDNEQILIYRGKDWKSKYPVPLHHVSRVDQRENISSDLESSGQSSETNPDQTMKIKKRSASPKMLSLWRDAIDSSKASLLDSGESELSPDSLLKLVEEFESASQAMQHSFPALIVTNGEDEEEERNNDESQIDTIHDQRVDRDQDIVSCGAGDLGDFDDVAPFGSLPIDKIVERLSRE